MKKGKSCFQMEGTKELKAKGIKEESQGPSKGNGKKLATKPSPRTLPKKRVNLSLPKK